MEPATFVEAVRSHLSSAGYEVTVHHVVDSEARPNQGRTYWELTGRRRNRFALTARVSTGPPTFNHCFEGFSDFASDVDPVDHDSILVVHIRDLAS